MKLEFTMLKMFEIWKILGYKHILFINLYILFTLTTMKLWKQTTDVNGIPAEDILLMMLSPKILRKILHKSKIHFNVI